MATPTIRSLRYNMRSVYILSCETPKNQGGIYKYSLNEKGLTLSKYFACDRPMYAVIENGRLFVLLRQPFVDDLNSGVFSIDLNLENPSEIISTNGKVACHLAVKDGDVYVVNYLSGNLVKLLDKTVTHSGKGVNFTRQEMPHTHCVTLSNDNKFLLCCDLGLDTLFCYDKELNELSKIKVKDGYGIRHAIFSKDGKYVYAVTEMIPSVLVFSFDNGRLKLLNEYKISCEKEAADGAGIRLSKDGKFLYLSLRVENDIVVYEIKGDSLILKQIADCLGDSPRDFNLAENIIIVSNEKSDSVTVFNIDGGIIADKIQELRLNKPLCVITE